MSDIRFNQWLHQSGTGGVSQDHIGNIGIGTTNPSIVVSAANTAVLNVGVITANNLFVNNAFNGDITGNVTGNISGATGTFSGNVDIADKIIHTGDTDTAMRFPADNTFAVDTAGSERLRIHADGEVECKGGGAGQNALLVTGNYSSGNNVDIQTWQRIGGAVQAKLIYKDADTSVHFGTDTAHQLCLMTGGTERLRITSGGQLNFGGDLTQTGFTASITRNSSETDILRIKGNGGNAFIRFEDNDASSSFTLGADDAVGSGGFALYDRSDSAYRLVVDTDGRVSINATSPAQIGGQTPYLYVASSYTNLDGLRIRGLDTGNTLWKTGGDMSLSVASNDAINLKTNGTTRFVLNANSNNSTTLSIGNGSNLNNNTSPDRTSVKIGGTLHLEASFQGQNHRTGMYYNCYASGQNNFYQGTFGASAQDYRAAAATMKGGHFKVYTDPGTSTNYSAGAQITTMKETLSCANGFVTAPNQPRFFARRSTDQTSYDGRNVGGTWITYDVEDYDIGGNFATSGSDQGRFIAPVSGLYLFQAAAYKNTATADWSQAWFDVDGSRKNGTDWVFSTSTRFAQNSIQIYLTAGQKIGFHPYNNASGNTILDSQNHTWFKGCLLG